MEQLLLPVVRYMGRQRPREDLGNWKNRRRDSSRRVLLATQIMQDGALYVGAIHVEAWIDYCGGLLVSSAKICRLEAGGGRLNLSFANFGLHTTEYEQGTPHVPQVGPDVDAWELVARSLRAGVLTYAFESKRRMLGWVDKVDGRLSAIMAGIEGPQWVPMTPQIHRSWISYPTAERPTPLVSSYLQDPTMQVQVDVHVHETAPINNLNSGNDCRLTWCEIDIPQDKDECGTCGESLYGDEECGECGGQAEYDDTKWRTDAPNIVDYPILMEGGDHGAVRDEIIDWWQTLPSGEFNNG